MPETTLLNCRIIIVEDEFFLAEDLRYELSKAGAVVVGTASAVEDALELISRESDLHAAILDVNLAGKPVFPVADRLIERGIPFVFTTGYDASSIPAQYKDVARFEKPFNVTRVLRSLMQFIRS
jgi:DNA-binding NtrC family response regulator